MHYCKTCQWAIPTDLDDSYYCSLLGFTYKEPDPHITGACAVDCEGYNIALLKITNPNIFGCLCHSDLKPELLI